MAGWTAPPSFTTGTPLSAASLNIIAADLQFLGAVPIGQAYTTVGSTSVPGPNTPTLVAMSYAWLSGSMAFSGNQFTVPFAGKYLFYAQVAWAAADASATYYAAQLYQNGSAVASGSESSIANPGLLTVEVEYVLVCNANDTVALYAEHDDSTAYSVTGTLGGFWVSN